MSSSLLAACGGLDSLVQFFPSDGSFLAPPDPPGSRNLKRRRRTGVKKSSKRSRGEKSPGVILSDSDCGEASDLEQAVEELASQLPASLPQLCAVDVCSSPALLATFLQEWRSRRSYSLAVAVDRSSGSPLHEELEVEIGRVVGLAVSWSQLDVFFLSLTEEGERLDDSLCPASQDPAISLSERLAAVSEVLRRPGTVVTMLGWRQQASLLYTVLGWLPGGQARDPGVAAWLLDPASQPPTLSRLVLDHCPRLLPLLATLGSGPGTGSVAANPAANQPARHRALAEAVLARQVMVALETCLETAGLLGHFTEVEMGSEVVLVKMELTGMGLNEAEYEDTRLLLQARVRIIEDQAFR